MTTRPATVCRRAECRQRFDQHIDGQCPGSLAALTFQTIKKRAAASQSFSEAEVAALDELVRSTLNGSKDLALRALRSEPGKSIMRKIFVMKASIAKQQK